MNEISLTVNGKQHTEAMPARMHLADFLREQLHLTGTHIGCEHGVCGACTLLVDGEPTRSCITFATACAGRDIRSIEGLEDDIITAALRHAFSAAHALQCGYCTPGMLVTARDIVIRLPEADDARIRLELAGNLCRCTGYNGIVRAIRMVLDARLEIGRFAPQHALAALPQAESMPPPQGRDPAETIKPVPNSSGRGADSSPAAAVTNQQQSRPAQKGPGLYQQLQVSVARDVLWQALQDPALVASCIPGASLTGVEASRITGEMAVSLGPIQGKFTGYADISYGDFTGIINGEGQDQISKTRLSAQADFAVVAVSATESLLDLNMRFSLRGALAQFARGPVIQAFADEIAAIVAQNLQAKLTGGKVTGASPRLSAWRLLWAVLRRRFGGGKG